MPGTPSPATRATTASSIVAAAVRRSSPGATRAVVGSTSPRRLPAAPSVPSASRDVEVAVLDILLVGHGADLLVRASPHHGDRAGGALDHGLGSRASWHDDKGHAVRGWTRQSRLRRSTLRSGPSPMR